MDQPNYYAIIPANVRYSNKLKANAKLLYGEITALSHRSGYCWSSNGYFAELYGVNKKSISLWLKQLKEEGFINIQINYKKGSKEIESRYLQIITHPMENNITTPGNKKVIDNNTSFNNTSITSELPLNINPIKKKKKKFVPPTESEVIDYFKEKRYSIESAKKAFEYYQTGDWKDSQGNQVRNWKQKMISVWFKTENKTQSGGSFNYADYDNNK